MNLHITCHSFFLKKNSIQKRQNIQKLNLEKAKVKF